MYIFISLLTVQHCNVFYTQKVKAVMRNIPGPICIAMFVASCGGGAGTNPFDNPADSNTATTDETSNKNTGTTVQGTQTHRKTP